jgi:uncharacterized membrane protein
VLFFFGVAMFLPAGDITWTRGWTFLLLLFLLVAPSVLYLWRVNPEIFVARSKIHEGTKSWDKALLFFRSALVALIFPLVVEF